MKYKVKKISEFESSIEITVDFDDLEDKKDEAISKIGKSLKVKGFRPGKIPKNIVTVSYTHLTLPTMDSV